MQVLRDEGLVQTVTGKGVYVVERPKKLALGWCDRHSVVTHYPLAIKCPAMRKGRSRATM
jgi:hypothetical protein